MEEKIDTMMSEVRVKDKELQMKAMLKYIFFTFNWPENWIKKCFANEGEVMIAHLQEKWENKDCNFNRFFVELDASRQREMLDWIVENYHGADKLANEL